MEAKTGFQTEIDRLARQVVVDHGNRFDDNVNAEEANGADLDERVTPRYWGESKGKLERLRCRAER